MAEKDISSHCEDCHKQYNDIDQTNYENQGKLKQYLGRVEVVNQELEKLGQRLREKQAENDQLRIKNGQLQSQLKTQATMQAEVDALKETLQSRNNDIEALRGNKLDLNNTIQELREQLGSLLDYQNKVAMLSSEIERQNKKLGNREAEINSLKATVQEKTLRIEELEKAENDKFQLENKVALLASEIDRQSNVLKNKERVNIEINKTIADKDNLISELKQMENEIEALQRQLQAKDAEISDWRQKYEKLEDIENKYNDSQNKVYNLENKIAMLSSEIERQNVKLNNRTKELEELKQKYAAFEVTLQEYQGVEAENQRLKTLQAELENHVDELKTKSNHQGQDIVFMAADLDSFKNDIHQLSKERDGAIEVINQLKKELEDLRDRFQHLQEELKGLQDAEFKISNLENKTAMLSSEIERLSKMVESKNAQIDQLKLQGVAYQQEIDSLRSLEQEVDRISQAHVDTTKEVADQQELRRKTQEELENALHDKGNLENKVAMLSTEIERFQIKLKNRVEDVEKLNLQNLELEKQLKEQAQFPSDIERLERLLEEQKVARVQAEDKGRQVEVQLSEVLLQKEQIENKTAMLSAEIERLTKLNDKKNSEVDVLKQRVAELEEQVLDLQKSEQKMYEYETKLAFLSQEIERQTNQYKVKLGEVESAKAQLLDAQKQLSDQEALHQELVRLESVLQAKSTEADTWRDKVVSVENELIVINDIKVFRLLNSKFQYENKIALLSSEVERQSKKYANLERANNDLTEQRNVAEDDSKQAYELARDRSKEAEELRRQLADIEKLQNKLQQQQLILVLSFAENETLRQRVVEINRQLEDVRRVKLGQASQE